MSSPHRMHHHVATSMRPNPTNENTFGSARTKGASASGITGSSAYGVPGAPSHGIGATSSLWIVRASTIVVAEVSNLGTASKSSPGLAGHHYLDCRALVQELRRNRQLVSPEHQSLVLTIDTACLARGRTSYGYSRADPCLHTSRVQTPHRQSAERGFRRVR